MQFPDSWEATQNFPAWSDLYAFVERYGSRYNDLDKSCTADIESLYLRTDLDSCHGDSDDCSYIYQEECGIAFTSDPRANVCNSCEQTEMSDIVGCFCTCHTTYQSSIEDILNLGGLTKVYNESGIGDFEITVSSQFQDHLNLLEWGTSLVALRAKERTKSPKSRAPRFFSPAAETSDKKVDSS